MNAKYNNVPGFSEYLDLDHQYYIVIPLAHELESDLIDCHFIGDNGLIKDGFKGMVFSEKEYSVLESYLFNFIDAECGLLISMYEEEFVSCEMLPKVISITQRMLDNSDDPLFLKLANELLSLLQDAERIGVIVGFCF